MLTLSLPSSPDGAAMLKKLLSSFRALRRRKLWRQTVLGGVFVVEATVSDEGYHLHLHSVLFSAFIPWDALKADWEAITGASGVYIQKIPRKAAVGYLTKYLTKPGEDPETLRELSGELKGARFFQPFGDWHNKLKPEKKVPYKCPKCGDVNWLPEEYFNAARYCAAGWRAHSPRSPYG
jgi:hypothetical protein